jgi:alpha-N-acetylglucosaminidase
VTTSYTSAFWSWEDWELQLDWMALHGINLGLAWIGFEKIVIEVFSEAGFTDSEINSFLSGPAFLAWNHFGNIQGSWGGDLPHAWVDSQFAMQKQIVARMVELGITPILPAFPGFVPENVTRVWPNASIAKSPQWSGFPAEYTDDTYLTPYDPHFAQLQTAFIGKQQEVYGNVTSFWTLDQFNENQPASGDLDYLHNVSHNTWQTLKAADPSAVWVMQGWLFASDSTFWTDARVQAFLDGITVDADMLILDLFAESSPQWLRTDSFYGKPWIWCQLHGYGGNMGLYGQIENVTVNSMDAVRNSSSLVGFGLSMEGQEGNEIMYDLLLDQAWSKDPIDTESYFHDWVSTRYGASSESKIPAGLYSAWETVRPTVYNNTNMTVTAVTKSLWELVPATTGLNDVTGHHATVLTYDTDDLVAGWKQLYQAGLQQPPLFANAAYQYDLVDWTRQVLANAFIPIYDALVADYQRGKSSSTTIKTYGEEMNALLQTIDAVLNTNPSFRLSTWIDAARATGDSDADFFEYTARNQITLWGPTGQIEDYASKQWAGLVGTYYAKRWEMFVGYLEETEPSKYNYTAFEAELHAWEYKWVEQTTSSSGRRSEEDTEAVDLKTVMQQAIKSHPNILKT